MIPMIPFSKYSGAGNDFVVVDAAEGVDDPASLARSLCPRSTGVGVDGMALVRRTEDGGLHVRFFNPDGSEFAVCGNGTRCVARWAADAGLGGDGRIRLTTGGGEVEAELRDGEVALSYAIRSWIEGRRVVPFGGNRREGWLVRMGTPHFVLPLEELPEGSIDEVCRTVRSHEAMGPEGANVNLVAWAGEDRVRIRTFERGVEGETPACGSGAMAAALALHADGRCGPELRLLTRSGAQLGVSLEPDGPDPGEPAVRRVRLSGPARFVFRGSYPRRRGGPGPVSRAAGSGTAARGDDGRDEGGA